MVSTFVRPTLVVFGGAPEITSAWFGSDVVHGSMDAELPPTPTAVVFDLRAYSAPELSTLRGRQALASLPLLLIGQGLAAEPIARELRADDAIDVSKVTADELRRRIALVLEVGRLRLVASFAEQALEQSVNGLSIVNIEAPGEPLVHVTPVFERMTGFRRAEVLGKNCRFLQGDERDQPARAQLRDAVRARTATTVVIRNFRRDGTPFWNELTVFPLVAHGHPTPWMAGVQHDVTLLVEARAEIEHLYKILVERQRFDHSILDGVAVGIATSDHDGRVTFVNRAAAELLDVAQEGVELRVDEILGLASAPHDLIGDEARRSLSYPHRTPTGRELDLELSVSRGEGDERAGFFFIFRDVRDEKLREAERQRFERLAAVGTMVAGFAHEVRNPLAAMRSLAEELDEELRDANIALPHVELMLQSVERIERLVRTSLQFGRPAAPRRAQQRPWVIASAALSSLRPRLRDLAGEIALDVEPGLPDVNVDERQIAQALVILLNNALDATGAAPRVGLRVRAGRDNELRSVRIEVHDDGPGIAPEIVNRIFDPFFTTKPSGTGLGLSIAQQIAQENGCRIEVTSEPGRETCFAIVIALP